MLKFFASPKEPLQNEEIQTLFANIDLILAHSDEILKNEAYRNIHVKGIGIDGIYMGHINLYLGDLVALWTNGSPWKNGQKFYYHLGGSPLSGMSFCTYWAEGKTGCDKSNPSFGTLFRPACMVLKKLKEDFKCVTLDFPKREVSALKVCDLIEKLKN